MGRILKRYPRLLVATLSAVATAGVAAAQQATVVGTLEGHTDPVYAVAWSPDGKTLATASFDNTVRLWDTATRKEIKKFDGHTKLVLAVAIAPDGKHVLSGSQDNTAKIWDYPTSGPVKTFPGLPAAIEALAIKPDGKQFAAAAGKSIKVWDPNTGAVIKDLEGHAGEVASAAWRGDGGQLATGDKANTIRLWKADLTPDTTIECPSPAVLGLAFLPNNQQLVSAGSDGIARLWQLPAAAPRRFEAKGPIAAVAVSGGATKLAAGGDKVVQIWNPADGKLIKEINVDQPVIAVALRQDGSQVAVALANQTARIFDAADGKELKKVEGLAAPITALAFRGDGARLAIAGDDNTIRVIDTGDGKTVKELKGHRGRIHALSFAPGRQPPRLGVGRHDCQAMGRQPGQGHPRFCGARGRRPQRRRESRWEDHRHRLDRQDSPNMELGRR